ncbi:hypothetical protein NBZ79_00605 [Sneathiella marina]|uniref:Uncharacterized protein n=1 Tax=Sneathiella marina TaxID=2950108 RepID=A0ABY4W2Q1_9PROT|nr:hypothetical protein [Sneathiella marina]USG61475.1 hypothetical protein NBZ79_00605 [Sneathiella marina]
MTKRSQKPDFKLIDFEEFSWMKDDPFINEEETDVVISLNEISSKSVEKTDGESSLFARKILYWNDVQLKSYDWITYVRNMSLDMQDYGSNNVLYTISFEVETPVAKATNRDWVDCTFNFRLLNSNGAYLFPIHLDWNRGCGKYLFSEQHETKTNVADVVKHIDSGVRGGNFHLRVTGC